MDSLKQPALCPSRSPAYLKGAATTDETVPARRDEARRTAVDDQKSYDAAVSEGWPVAPHR